MSNLVAFGLGDAWQCPSGQMHSRNCACRNNDPFRKDAARVKVELIESNHLVARLVSAWEINPLYFGAEETLDFEPKR